MRVLVVTVVHHPADARILHRQISAMLDRGHRVCYAAPFRAFGVLAPPGVEALDLPRSAEWRRAAAVWAARRVLARRGCEADLIMLHDPELLAALPGLRRHWRRKGAPPVVVWDVHEDTGAALGMKPYLPAVARPALAALVRAAERVAEQQVRLLLAEECYQDRFRWTHPVVPNLARLPLRPPLPPGDGRVVYLGHLSEARGALDLIEMSKAVPPQVRLDVIGAADRYVHDALTQADHDGILRWHGFIPNDQALDLLRGALAGISLLHDQPNYRHSRHTKLVEYMACGLPVVTTPNPYAADLVEQHGCGLVVPFRHPRAAADAVATLRADPELRRSMAARGYHAASSGLDWAHDAGPFVAQLEAWVDQARPVRPVFV